MKGSKALKAALDELAKTLAPGDNTQTLQTLRSGLTCKSSSLLVQAAELTAHLDQRELALDLREAFVRLMDVDESVDPDCLARTAIVESLHRVESYQADIFQRAMAFFWPFRPVKDLPDKAARLRIAAASAHADLAPADELNPLIDLLFDPIAMVRQTAVRALAAMGGTTVVALLRFKVLNGDPVPRVTEECFTGLLRCAGDTYVPFVGSYLRSPRDDIRVAAALAIGESGLASGLDVLRACWQTSADPDFKIDLLVAIALLRQDRAFQFLIGLIGEEESAGRDAIAALATYRSNPSICQQVEAALKRCNNPNLERVFRDKFGRP